MIGIAIVGLGNLALGIWVLSLMTDLYLARETIRTKDKIICDQKAYIEINLGVLLNQTEALTSAERALEELPRLRRELQFGRAMKVEKPGEAEKTLRDFLEKPAPPSYRLDND